jgi:hypothetical protein
MVETLENAEMMTTNGSASALEQITRGETELQVETAKKYPRSVKAFKQTALEMATLDQDTAASCFYSMRRGGNLIEGPSVRLAEICAVAWGNLICGARIVNEDDRFVTAQGVAWDTQRNVRVTIETRRRITDKNGRKYSDDMVGVTSNAAASIAFRNALFKCIPAVYIKSIYEQAREVAVGNNRTLADRRQRAFEWFRKAGVMDEEVLAYVEKPSMDDVDLDDLAALTGLRTAIRDGDTTIDQAFAEARKKLMQEEETSEKERSRRATATRRR